MPEPSNETVQPPASNAVLVLVIAYAATLLIVVGVASWLLWNGDNPIIMFAPAAIWEWSFAGGMAAVLHRLASPRLQKPAGPQLYVWALATPIVGLFMGATVYFIALAGARLVGAPGNLKEAVWLNAIAFFGGFRSELSIPVIGRFFGSRVREEGRGEDEG